MHDRIMGISDIVSTDISDMPSHVKTYNDYLRWCHGKYDTLMPHIPTKSYTGHVGEVGVVIDKGRYIVSCAACGSNYMINKLEQHFLCASCEYTPGRYTSHNVSPRRRTDKQWMRVVWPEQLDQIENEILMQPGRNERSPYRDWEPGWTLEQLVQRTKLTWQAVEKDPAATGLSISSTRLWAVGEVVTAANVIRYINNVMNDLAGRRNPPVQFEDSIEVLDGPGRYILFPRGTTAQRPAIPKVGSVRFNTTQGYAEICTSARPITWVPWGTGTTAPVSVSAGGNLNIDHTITHGSQISGWNTARSRIVLGHSLGKPARGFQLSLVLRVAISGENYDVGNEVLIPHNGYISDSNWYKVNMSSVDSTTTAVLQILTSGSGVRIPLMDRDNSGSSVNIAENQAYMKVALWG